MLRLYASGSHAPDMHPTLAAFGLRVGRRGIGCLAWGNGLGTASRRFQLRLNGGDFSHDVELFLLHKFTCELKKALQLKRCLASGSNSCGVLPAVGASA